MNLTAATITIYFLGLTNFDTTSGYKAVVPLATSNPTVGPVTLASHRTDLVITNWSSMITGECTSLGGKPFGSSPASICVVSGLEHQEIEVVSSEALTVKRRFNSIPSLKAHCPLLGDLDANVGTAVKMAVSNGTLDACMHGQAWIASLAVDVAGSNNFKLGQTSPKPTVTLPGGAVVNIITVPTSTTHSSEHAHFFWHYYMRQNHSTCSALPDELKPVPECYECLPGIPPPLPGASPTPHHPEGGGSGSIGWPVATGVGCSVTQYP